MEVLISPLHSSCVFLLPVASFERSRNLHIVVLVAWRGLWVGKLVNIDTYLWHWFWVNSYKFCLTIRPGNYALSTYRIILIQNWIYHVIFTLCFRNNVIDSSFVCRFVVGDLASLKCQLDTHSQVRASIEGHKLLVEKSLEAAKNFVKDENAREERMTAADNTGGELVILFLYFTSSFHKHARALTSLTISCA